MLISAPPVPSFQLRYSQWVAVWSDPDISRRHPHKGRCSNKIKAVTHFEASEPACLWKSFADKSRQKCMRDTSERLLKWKCELDQSKGFDRSLISFHTLYPRDSLRFIWSIDSTPTSASSRWLCSTTRYIILQSWPRMLLPASAYANIRIVCNNDNR